MRVDLGAGNASTPRRSTASDTGRSLTGPADCGLCKSGHGQHPPWVAEWLLGIVGTYMVGAFVEVLVVVALALFQSAEFSDSTA